MLVRMPIPHKKDLAPWHLLETVRKPDGETYYRNSEGTQEYGFHTIDWQCEACTGRMLKSSEEGSVVLYCPNATCIQQGLRFVERNGGLCFEYPDSAEKPVTRNLPRLFPPMKSSINVDTGEKVYRPGETGLPRPWNQCTWRCGTCDCEMSHGEDFLVCRTYGCVQRGIEFPVRKGAPCQPVGSAAQNPPAKTSPVEELKELKAAVEALETRVGSLEGLLNGSRVRIAKAAADYKPASHSPRHNFF